MSEEIHAYCDASTFPGRSAGAIYVNGEIVIRRYKFEDSYKAELMTMIAAAEMADVVHHDQVFLSASLKRGKRKHNGLIGSIRKLIQSGKRFIPDGHKYPEYHACHRAAQIACYTKCVKNLRK